MSICLVLPATVKPSPMGMVGGALVWKFKTTSFPWPSTGEGELGVIYSCILVPGPPFVSFLVDKERLQKSRSEGKAEPTSWGKS